MSDNKDVQPDEYRRYLDRKHSGFSTNSDLIAQVISRATNSNLLTDGRIVEGEVNEVHRIITNTGERVIVRISRSSKPRFESERWAIESVRKIGVPAPEVLLLEKCALDENNLTFCVEKEMEGMPLKDFIMHVGVESEEARKIIEEAGVVLAKIHSVSTDGFGDLNPEGKGKYISWKDYMLDSVIKTDEIIQIAKEIGLDLRIAEKAFRTLESNSNLFSSVRPHLQHGDYGLDHIFVKENKISGVIDFENCKGGDRTWDFSWWSFFGGNRPSIKWLEEGYKKISNLPTDYDLKLVLGRIKLGLDLVRYYNYEHNNVGIELSKKRLTEDVQRF